MKMMLSFLSILLTIVFAIFCSCNTATAHMMLPNHGMAGNLITDPIHESYSQLDLSLTQKGEATLYEFAGLQMFGGFHSDENPGFHTNAFWDDYGPGNHNRPYTAFSFFSNFYSGDNGWFSLSLVFFSKSPMNDHWSGVLEERLDLLVETIDKFFIAVQPDPNPTPTPIPTSLLLLASGLVGFVGLRRISRT